MTAQHRDAAWTAYLDIETATRPEVLARLALEAGVAPDDVAAMARFTAEHAGVGALSSLKGRVVCWAVLGSDDRESSECSDADEGAMLARLDEQLAGASRIVAYNGHGFDFQFLGLRGVATGVVSLARRTWFDKPWTAKHLVDPLSPGWSRKPAGAKGWTLDAMAEALHIVRAPTLPGADVPAAWYAGRYDEIRAHCVDDVRTLRAVTLRLAEGRAA